jgi:hypothetical protein
VGEVWRQVADLGDLEGRFNSADRVFDSASLAADPNRSLLAEKFFHTPVGRDYGAMAPTPKVMGNFAPGSPGVLTRQPHRQHPRFINRARFSIGPQGSRLQAENAAHRFFHVRKAKEPRTLLG